MQCCKANYNIHLLSLGNNFKPLQGLDVQVAHQLLKAVAEKEMSIQEMMTECKEIKSLKEIQTALMKETGVPSWAEAEEMFPTFITAEALHEFWSINFKSGSTQTRFA